MEEPVTESALNAMREGFSSKFLQYKRNRIRAVRDEVFELSVRLRAAEDVDEVLSIIRSANTSIAILQDYLSENISDQERSEIIDSLQDLYELRQTAAKSKPVVASKYQGYIQVNYPSIN